MNRLIQSWLSHRHLLAACAALSAAACTERVAQESAAKQQSAVVAPDGSVAQAGGILVEAWSREAAAAELSTRGEIRVRGTFSGSLIEAVSGSLATSASESNYANTLTAFLQRYGVLFAPSDQEAPSEPVQLNVVGDPLPFHSSQASGVYVRLSQVVDGFAVDDCLIIGRFEGLSLARIAGAIYDPARSPTQDQQLALPDAQTARSRFLELHIVSDATASAFAPTGFVRYRTPGVVWRYGSKQLDAVTGQQIRDLPSPIVD
jgi:hypothetical protein